VSIQDLQQNPQDTSNFYLANMYQATINPNASSSLPTSPPPFTPPNFAIWVNALWFLSLVISITCALLATLLQQWARRYLKFTQPRYSPHRRARIRAFFAEGVDKFLLPWAVEALPTMLHLSLFLFFAGLAVFLWNVNLTIFKLVLSWIGLCTALYGSITFIPIFHHDSPYHTPLSSLVWHLIKGIPFLIFQAVVTFAGCPCCSYAIWCYSQDMAENYRKLLAQGMRKMAEETAFNSPSEIDTRAFLWAFDSLDEDHELERFFSGLPGFRRSKMVKDPLPGLTSEQREKLLKTWVGLLDRTSSSDLLPEPAKIRRTVICAKAIGPAGVPGAIDRLVNRIVSVFQFGPVQSTEIARSLRGRANGPGRDEETTMKIRAIVLSVIARAQRRDDLWFAMASDEMVVPESVLRNHATHGNDLSLAILLHVVRQQFSFFDERNWPWEEFSKVLEAASKFDVLDTSPELQHEFCALWNEVPPEEDYPFLFPKQASKYILRPIRNIYLTLHLHTDSAPTAFDASTGDDDLILWYSSSYPKCNIPDHHPDPTPHIHDATTPTAIARADVHDNAALVPSSLSSTPDTSSPSVPTPVRIDENTMDGPLLNNDISAPASSHTAHQPAAENVSDSATSPEPLAATSATLDTDTSARPIPPTTSETSTSTASVHPTGEHSLQNIADLHLHSDSSEIPFPGSPEPVLYDIMGQSLSLTLSHD
jgi:hypothetical protein